MVRPWYAALGLVRPALVRSINAMVGLCAWLLVFDLDVCLLLVKRKAKQRKNKIERTKNPGGLFYPSFKIEGEKKRKNKCTNACSLFAHRACRVIASNM